MAVIAGRTKCRYLRSCDEFGDGGQLCVQRASKGYAFVLGRLLRQHAGGIQREPVRSSEMLFWAIAVAPAVDAGTNSEDGAVSAANVGTSPQLGT